MEIKPLADRLVKHYRTRDPFRIATALGYIIIDTPLEGIRGFYQYLHRCHIIYLDNSLSEQERRWVCAHELGHSILHKNLNRIFMDTRTYMCTTRYERDADRFAVDLLYSDDGLRGLIGFSLPSIAENLGVSCDLAEYRMSNLVPEKQKSVYGTANTKVYI